MDSALRTIYLNCLDRDLGAADAGLLREYGPVKRTDWGTLRSWWQGRTIFGKVTMLSTGQAGWFGGWPGPPPGALASRLLAEFPTMEPATEIPITRRQRA